MKKQVLTQKVWVSALTLTALVGCSDNDPDFYRSADGLATAKLSLYVEAQVHTHYDDNEVPEETHTTVVAEFYGFDREGYYYMVELGDNDSISAGPNNQLQTLQAKFYPQTGTPLSVHYYRDFPNIDSGAVFDVVFDRASDTALHSTSVTLPTTANFSLIPEDPSIALDEATTFNWDEQDEQQYALKIAFTCGDEDGEIAYRSHVHFPNHQMQVLTPPFDFTPADYFASEAVDEFAACEMRSTLKTSLAQTPAEDHPFEALEISSTREQNITRTITSD